MEIGLLKYLKYFLHKLVEPVLSTSLEPVAGSIKPILPHWCILFHLKMLKEILFQKKKFYKH